MRLLKKWYFKIYHLLKLIGVFVIVMLGNIVIVNAENIPKEYQEVEYIGITDGRGYINTGYKPSYNTKVETNAINTTTLFLFGVDSDWANSSFALSRFYAEFSNKYEGGSVLYNMDKTKLTLSKDGFLVNDNVSKTFTNASNFTSNYEIYIFALNRKGTAREWGKGRIYDFKIYEENIIQRDFIPCYIKATNEIGLYDLVTKEFYSFTGTSLTLEKGEDIITPEPPTPSNDVIGEFTSIYTDRLEYLGTESMNNPYVEAMIVIILGFVVLEIFLRLFHIKGGYKK